MEDRQRNITRRRQAESQRTTRLQQTDGTRDSALPQQPAESQHAPRVRQGEPRKPMPASRRTIAKWRNYAVRACTAIMFVGCILGFVFFLRPSASALENRNLTPFPAPSAETFLDGQFFTDVSLWYADTYPFRDQLVGAARSVQSLYGIQPQTQMIGGNRISDQLPPVDGSGTSDESAAETSAPVAAEGGRAERREVDAPEARARAQEMEDQITDGIYVADGACYTLYYFDQDATQAYADVINDAAKQLEGTATVYSVVLPTNAGVMLDDETLASLGVPNQEQAIDYFYSLMDDDVVTVETYDVLSNHKDEYLYFRTDHHWTQLAAYYVYTSLCAAKNIQPAPYDEWEELEFSPFWGEYGSFVDIKSIAEADSVIARIPQGTNSMEFWLDDLDAASRNEGAVITDLSDAGEDDNKYNCFVCGNRPLSHIHNPAVTDGSSCLIIKDSFGNPFASTLVDSYEDIYTFDFRYSSLNIIDFVKDHGIQDVIFENVLMFAGTYNCSDALAAMISPDNEYRCDFEFEGTSGGSAAGTADEDANEMGENAESVEDDSEQAA